MSKNSSFLSPEAVAYLEANGYSISLRKLQRLTQLGKLDSFKEGNDPRNRYTEESLRLFLGELSGGESAFVLAISNSPLSQKAIAQRASLTDPKPTLIEFDNSESLATVIWRLISSVEARTNTKSNKQVKLAVPIDSDPNLIAALVEHCAKEGFVLVLY